MQSGNSAGIFTFMCTETLKSVFINSLINLGMAFAVFRSVESIRFWGTGGLFMDLAATAVLMPFLMTLVMTKVLGAEDRKSKLPTLLRTDGRQGMCLRLMPQTLLVRGLSIAGLAFLVLLPVTTILLLCWGKFPMGLKDVLILKAVFGGAIAALVTPLIIAGGVPSNHS